MEQKNSLVVFQGKGVRREWHKGEWYFSVIDIAAILTDQSDYQKARKYWNKLSQRLREEGSEVVTKCHQLKLPAEDKKLRETDCANTESMLRIVQSIPSKKAEPFKRWLAQLGKERIEEIENPELAQDRAKEYYKLKGYPKEWIEKRIRGIAVRQELTDEWEARGVKKEKEYAILTNEISKATFGIPIKQHKQIKGLNPKFQNQNLRDHMTDWELIFTMLGEKASADITRTRDAKGFNKCKSSARRGGQIAQNAKKELEKETEEKVVSKDNYLQLIKQKKKQIP